MSSDDRVNPDPPVTDQERWECPQCHETVRPVFLESDQRPACPKCGYYFPTP